MLFVSIVPHGPCAGNARRGAPRRARRRLRSCSTRAYGLAHIAKASWRSGYATDCKSVYTGSIPVLASKQNQALSGHPPLTPPESLHLRFTLLGPARRSASRPRPPARTGARTVAFAPRPFRISDRLTEVRPSARPPTRGESRARVPPDRRIERPRRTGVVVVQTPDRLWVRRARGSGNIGPANVAPEGRRRGPRPKHAARGTRLMTRACGAPDRQRPPRRRRGTRASCWRSRWTI